MMVAEEYLNPGRVASSGTLSTPVDTPLPSTPTQKFFPPNMPPPPYSSHQQLTTHRNSRYEIQPCYQIFAKTSLSRYGSTPGVNEAFSTLGSRSLRYSSNFFSQSCDPLKLLEDESDCVAGGQHGGQHGGQQYQQRSGTMGRHPKPRPPNVALPLDNEVSIIMKL